MDAIIEWSGLRHDYAQGPTLRFEDLALPLGQHLLLRGASGSGKSTLLAMAAGLLTPSAGSLLMAGQALQRLSARERDAWRGANLGFLPQRLHLSASLSVNENLELVALSAGLRPEPGRADALLAGLGLSGLGARPVHRLSLGQAQRVALARALMRRPRFLLVDEPTANLDDESAAQVMSLLERAAAEQGACLVLATHDQRICAHIAAADACAKLGGLAWRELSLPKQVPSEGAR